ncbi:hypothetical protein VTI74DRAFT_2509 [Chaetomium olivicolor]
MRNGTWKHPCFRQTPTTAKCGWGRHDRPGSWPESLGSLLLDIAAPLCTFWPTESPPTKTHIHRVNQVTNSLLSRNWTPRLSILLRCGSGASAGQQGFLLAASIVHEVTVDSTRSSARSWDR